MATTSVSNSDRMKYLVLARLMQKNFKNWNEVWDQYSLASKIQNRDQARRSLRSREFRYKDVIDKLDRFSAENFKDADPGTFARICDTVVHKRGYAWRLEEFEKQFLGLQDHVKRRHPPHAHLHISIWGLQFKYPEMHFLNDLEVALPMLESTEAELPGFRSTADPHRDQPVIGAIISKQQFLCRSIISSSFSLADAYISGLLYQAATLKQIGQRDCDDEFVKLAKENEGRSLNMRVRRIVRFAFGDEGRADDMPFRHFLEDAKRYRDAIHHTTPFKRKGYKLGGRMTALYEIDRAIALSSARSVLESIVQLARGINGADDDSDITRRCSSLIAAIASASGKQGN